MKGRAGVDQVQGRCRAGYDTHHSGRQWQARAGQGQAFGAGTAHHLEATPFAPSTHYALLCWLRTACRPSIRRSELEAFQSNKLLLILSPSPPRTTLAVSVDHDRPGST
ncbi:hypothetical protein LIA77_10241 [Sarocladium implicatum]|nr:hypothetical protein LIA77_10241 [Sarocladium implicatum]